MQLTAATSLSSCLMRRAVFFLFLGVAIMASGLWLGRKGCTRCDPFLSKPLLITGFFIFFISVLGSGGAFDTNNKLVVFSQSVAVLLLFLLLTAFTIFAFVVSINGPRFHDDVEAIRSGNASAISRGGNRQFQGKSTWLQKRVTDEGTWQAIKRCLPKTPLCDKLGKKYPSDSDNSTNSTGWVTLPRLEAGCCRPPQDCNFDVINITYYVLSSNEDEDEDEGEEGVSAAAVRVRGSNNSDCSVYGNNATERCYGCNSCKAAFLESARGTWRTAAIINMCVIGLALVSSAYSFGKSIVRPSDVGLNAGPGSESLPSWSKKSGLEPPSSGVAGRPSSPSTLSGTATASGPAVTQGLEAERTAIGAAECRPRGRDLGRRTREAGDGLQMENGQNQQSSERSEIRAE